MADRDTVDEQGKVITLSASWLTCSTAAIEGVVKTIEYIVHLVYAGERRGAAVSASWAMSLFQTLDSFFHLGRNFEKSAVNKHEFLALNLIKVAAES
jgi:hypothetical protein